MSRDEPRPGPYRLPMPSQADLKKTFSYCPETGRLSKDGKLVGFVDGDGYVRCYFRGAVYAVHRLVYQLHYGECPPNLDHIDGDRVNSRIENLRPASLTENNRNRGACKHTSSRFKGVSFHAGRANNWRAQIRVNRKSHELGYFADEEDAARAVDTASIKYHGEFAFLNFPKEQNNGQ